MRNQPRPYGKHIIKHPASGIILLTALSGISSTVSAEPIAIPAGSLVTALNRLAENSDLQLVYDTAMTAGKKSPGIQGDFTPNQALGKLLQGTGLTHSVSGDGTIMIAAAPKTETAVPAEQSPPQKAAEPTLLKPMTVTAEAEDGEKAANDANDPYNNNYAVSNASTATKTNTPIMETPISIQTVPRAVIQDQQSIQLGDAIKNVSGVFQGTTFGGFAEQFMIRGFNTNYANYYDGFRFPASRLSLANAERVEIVKGAAANLYGRIEPGGMINVVTKRPQATPYYALEQQFGSYDLYRTTADATGAINKDGSLMYRLNFEYLNKNSFRDYGFTDRAFIAPSLTWKISDRTQLDLDFMYSNESTLEDYGIPSNSLTRRPADIPISRYLGEPSTDKSKTKLYNTGMTLTHAFNDDWKVRAKFNYLKRDVDDPQTFPIPFAFAFNAQTGLQQRNYYREIDGLDSYFGTVDVTGRFSTWGAKHNVLVGWDNYNAAATAQNYFYGANAEKHGNGALAK